MCDPMKQQGMHSGVEKQNLKPVSGRRIPRKGGSDILS
jgi:calcineurin-like phosphoesterase family protein